ncbi:peptidoglycan endopeptidase, partial [Clostridium perfringens]
VKLSNESTGWESSDYISIYTGSTSQTESSTNNPSNISKAQAIVKTAHEQLGKPYVWGSEGPNSFDCSGSVHYVFGKHEEQTPRASIDKYKVEI